MLILPKRKRLPSLLTHSLIDERDDDGSSKFVDSSSSTTICGSGEMRSINSSCDGMVFGLSLISNGWTNLSALDSLILVSLVPICLLWLSQDPSWLVDFWSWLCLVDNPAILAVRLRVLRLKKKQRA